MKPKVFIGSSIEGVKIADAIHFNLTYDAECTVWRNGVFQLSGTTLSQLINVLRNSDFGVFVFSPDDLTVMRNAASHTVRDNVLFELGLFVGRLGQERCFFLVPDGASNLRLPSDLAGITPGRFEDSRSDGNWAAALNPVCMQIRRQMEQLRSFQDATPNNTENTGYKTDKNIPPQDLILTKDRDVEAKYYKKGILVKGDSAVCGSLLEGIGSWNRSLSGWIVPRSKEKALKSVFQGMEIQQNDSATT